MRAKTLVSRASGPLLVFGGHASAQNGTSNLGVTQIQKVSDPVEGAFRPFVAFDVGGQNMLGLLDTGSSDLTVPKKGSEFCKIKLQQCDEQGTGFVAGAFDPQQIQNQVQKLDQPLNATFTGGAAFTGEFIKAPFNVPGAASTQVQMGLVDQGQGPPGAPAFPVMGLGPIEGESITNDGRKAYPNVPAQLKEDGKIKANAYGLYLGDFRSKDNGTIVWGGFDAAKFDGELKRADIVPDNKKAFRSFVVGLSSVSMTGGEGSGAQTGGEGQGGRNREGGGGRGQGDQSGDGAERGDERDQQGGGGNGRGGRGDRNQGAGSGGGRGGRDNGNRNGGNRNSGGAGANNRGGNDDRESEAGSRRSLLRRTHPGPRASYSHTIKRLSTRDLERRQRDGNILSDETPPVVLLDTGDPGIVLPVGTMRTIAKALGTEFNERDGTLAPVDCSRITPGMALTFGMNDDKVKINVPLDSVILGPAFDEPPGGELPKPSSQGLGAAPSNSTGSRGNSGNNETERTQGGRNGKSAGRGSGREGGKGSSGSSGSSGSGSGSNSDAEGDSRQESDGNPADSDRSRDGGRSRRRSFIDHGSYQRDDGGNSSGGGDRNGERNGSGRNANNGQGRGGRDGGRDGGRGASGRDGASKGPTDRESQGRGGTGRDSGGQDAGSGSGGSGKCQLSMSAADPQDPQALSILGAPAMQNMYLVFDMDSKVVMMAQAKVNETKTDLREYVPGGKN
ncbi:hypothetical protein HIM_09005 [Hirsutella minnesotensis 3608]|uniref:Peptidase A1 domain-containing protein n=1 Tax=Hirsutella minnesotensis 3608 TaxID=1043627 RepID=A0A0F7ZGW7_9HYPO|nr:hypothetical protein HIM_09005 [Hirsutella minnesotensis 3608]